MLSKITALKMLESVLHITFRRVRFQVPEKRCYEVKSNGFIMRKFSVFTIAALVISLTYCLALLVSAKAAGFQLRSESMSELGLYVEPPFVDVLAALMTVFTASVSFLKTAKLV